MPKIPEHTFNPQNVLPGSDGHVRVCRFPDGVVAFGALSNEGMSELTLGESIGTYVRPGFEKRIFKLPCGSIYMIIFVPEALGGNSMNDNT